MKAFIITLSNVESSKATAHAMIQPLTTQGFEVELFEGTPAKYAAELFKFEKRTLSKTVPINKKRTMKSGVLGCFYSHYRLWQKCVVLNEPIFIF
jgi:glycosyl transferase family 25